MSLYKISHKTAPKTSFEWDDSIIVDSKEKQAQSLIERNAGIIDDIQYFIETRDWSEEEAIEFVTNMRKRSPEKQIESEEDEE